jgi:hypothetical protein
MRFWRALAGALCGFGLAIAAGSAALAAPKVDQPYEIGFGDRMTTTVYLDGQGPFVFIIDTAASKTVLYEHVRARLDLKPLRDENIEIFGITGIATSVPYAVRELRLGDEALGPLEVVAVADPRRGQLAEPDGVLGLDVLTHYLVVLDRPNKRLKLFSPGSEPVPYIRWPGVPIEPRRLAEVSQEFWFFTARFEGEPSRALLDLGSGLTILNWQLARKLGFRENQFANPPDQIRDLLGRVSPIFILKELHVQVGQHKWASELAVVADARLFNLVQLSERPGSIVGAGLFKDDSIAIDFQGRRLRIAPGSRRY